MRRDRGRQRAAGASCAPPAVTEYSTGPGRPGRSPVIDALLAAALLLSTGCGGGGGGGGGTAAAPPPVSVSSVTAVATGDGALVTFTVSSPDGHSVTIRPFFSEDRGVSFASATVASGNVTNLEADASGTTYQFVWNAIADLSTGNQADLVIRLTSTDDSTGSSGLSADSSVFAIGSSTPPTVHSVTTPSGTQGGEITLSYTVSDPDGDSVGIDLAYSTDSGSTWSSATPGNGGDGTTAVTTATSAVSRSVVWNAQLDEPGLSSSTVRVRVTPVDVVTGTAGTSGSFTVNLNAPSIDLLTVGAIPETMNGTQTYDDSQGNPVSFGLTVPAYGYRLAVEYSAHPSGGALDLTTLSITCDRDLGSLPAGANLASQFDPQSSSGAWDVDSSHSMGLGTATFTATVGDNLGNVSNASTLELLVVSASSGNGPFDFVDHWWIDFESDFFTTSFTGGATVSISTSATPDSVADFEDDLRILGLRTDSPTAACLSLGTNAILLSWMKTETIGRLNELYGGQFSGTTSGYHGNLSFSASSGGMTSSIRIGGDDISSGFTLGRAQYDYRNFGGNHNRSTSLGVFTTNMIQFYVNSSFSFRNRFDPLIPGRGTPAGEHSLDHIVLDPAFDRLDPGNSSAENARYDDISDAIDGLARSSAVILAHEIGHSLGLVANDPPPLGLFGGVTEPSFAGSYTTAYHFDSPGNNVMAAALSFSTALISTSSGYRFNEINEAYLREWIILED